MAGPLIRIKRLVLAQRVVFTMKAEAEMYADGLTHELVFEAIIKCPSNHEGAAIEKPSIGTA